MKNGKVRILSLDPGTANTGHSLLYGNILQRTIKLESFGMITTKKTEEGTGEIRERIDYVGEQFLELVALERPTHIAVEDFTEQGKFVGKTYKEMAWLTEHFRLVGREMGFDVAVYENGYWKKETLGVMRANKAQVQHYVSHRLPEARKQLAGQPDHVWDSVGIGLCLWNLLLKTGEIEL